MDAKGPLYSAHCILRHRISFHLRPFSSLFHMMEGTIIENLSGQKLTMFCAGLVMCQVLICFHGAKVPSSWHTDQLLATRCYDPDGGDLKNWFYPRGKGGCRTIANAAENIEVGMENVVFSFQMPLPKAGIQLDYSRWQQNLIGVLTTDIIYNVVNDIEELNMKIKIDARLGYRNKGDPEGDWKDLATSLDTRNLECSIDNHKNRDGIYHNCSMLPLFDLGSLHHDFYLLNIRLHDISKLLPKFVELWLLVSNQNGGFTQIWVAMETVFSLIIAVEMIWFWRRVTMLRSPNLLESMLVTLGAALTLLNLPLEYFTLAYNMPWFGMIHDIRQIVFMTTILVFWQIFARQIIEEKKDGEDRRRYIMNLSVVLAVIFQFGFTLLVFNIYKGVLQLQNPFHFWITDLDLGFSLFAGVFTGLYLFFLCCYIIRRVCATILKRRFKFLLLTTVLIASLTLIGFIIGKVIEDAYKITGSLMIGVYGMWNIYIFSLLFLFAPSHKQGTYKDSLVDCEEMED